MNRLGYTVLLPRRSANIYRQKLNGKYLYTNNISMIVKAQQLNCSVNMFTPPTPPTTYCLPPLVDVSLSTWLSFCSFYIILIDHTRILIFITTR